MSIHAPHGFVWPAGLPQCAVCERPANDACHVTPGRPGFGFNAMAAVKHEGRLPVRSHAFTLAGQVASRIPCQLCGGTLADSRHPVGVPAGMMGLPKSVGPAEPATLAIEHDPETAFVSEINGRVVMMTRITEPVGVEVAQPRLEQVALERPAGAHTWIMGRYVEADAPNRNAAYWSTGDLQFGLPTVNAGPINWLHEAKHVLGCIVDSEMVEGGQESQTAGERLGPHIQVLGALWPWVNSQEVALTAAASEAGKLWLSMECISREVACLDEECARTMTYRDYVLARETACDHVKSGAPRRFVDPIFRGAGVIVPPLRPGWANADARVLAAQAETLVEAQAASFRGVADDEAVAVVATVISSLDQIEPDA